MADNIYGSSNFANANLSDAAWRATLPKWLQDQIRQVTINSGGDNPTIDQRWVSGDVGGFGSGNNDYGGYLRDEAGNPVAVLGGWNGQGVDGDRFLTDPSKVRIDPVLGRVVDPQYIKSTKNATPGIDWTMLAIALGAGALGSAAGLGAEAAAGAGEGAGYGSMTGLAGDETGGGLLAGTGGGSTGAGAGYGSMTGLAGNESAGLLGADGTMSGAGAGASGGLLSGQMPYMSEIPQPGPLAMDSMVSGPGNMPWYQSMLQGAMNNPLGTARTVMGVYNMANAAFGNKHPSAGHPQYAGGGVAQGVPTLNIGGGMGGGGFQQNPFLLRQMYSVPFMSGATGLLS